MVESESVWRALTSPHRRRILDLLKEGPLSTGQIAKQMPGLSRFAAMQHLDVLAEANLVLVRREGRNRFNFVNPAPISDLVERWVTSYGQAAATTAQHLKRYSETTPNRETNMAEQSENFRVVKIELEQEIKASCSTVFDALTTNINDWWPHRIRSDGRIVHENTLGGRIWELWDGGGALYGTITYLESGVRIISEVTGFAGACTFVNDESVKQTESGCVYMKSLKIWGDVPQELERMFAEGSAAIVKNSLKAYCEEGKTYDSHQ